MHVLIVEDDGAVRSTLMRVLTDEATDIQAFETGEDGLQAARTGSFDILILDVGLPGISGFEVAAALRTRGDQTPILFLTARDTEEDIVAGLEMGADDYITKPFSIPELRARVRAISRRRRMDRDLQLTFLDVVLDPTSREVTRGGKRVKLTEVEFKLLEAILRGRGETRTREDLLREVWRITFDPETGILDVHMSNLRKKLNRAGPPILETVRGMGYRLRNVPDS